jgi:hypothetical protein
LAKPKFSHDHAGAPTVKCRTHDAGAITVTITKKDPSDPPLPKVAVQLMLAPPPPTTPTPATAEPPPTYTALQQTHGNRVVFEGLAPGRYAAQAFHPGWSFVPAHVQPGAVDHLELVAFPNKVIWGCDTNQQTLDLARATATPQPCKFIGRYLSHDTNTDPGDQPLDSTEAPRYAAAGLDIVALWERSKYRAMDVAPGLEHEHGRRDATHAKHQLTSIGTSDQVVYFTADFTISKKQWLGGDGRRIRDYFTGIGDLMDVSKIGAYGTYATIVELFEAGLISHGWQMTFGTKGNKIDSRVHIYQYDIYPSQVGWLDTTHAGGLDLDCAIVPHFGQFRL